MEEKKDLRELLERMEKSNRQQARFARLQCLFSAIAALCCIGVLCLIVTLLPQINDMMVQADTVLTNVEQVSDQLADADLDGVMTNLEQVAQQIADADLGGIAEDVNQLVSTSQSGVEEAVEKLNGIDLDTLNKAIADLAAVVEPLANFFSRF